MDSLANYEDTILSLKTFVKTFDEYTFIDRLVVR